MEPLRSDLADLATSFLLLVGCLGGLVAWQDRLDPPSEPTSEAAAVPLAPAASRARRAQVALELASRQLGLTVRYVDLEEELILDRGVLPEDFDRLEVVLPVLVEALERYPAGSRSQVLREVQLHDVLWDGEVDWGGYARCKDRTIQFALSRFHAERPGAGVIHHEMGHLAWCSDRFPRDAWRALTGPVSGRTPAEVATEGSRWWQPEHLENGHLSSYAATTPAEDAADFNLALFGPIEPLLAVGEAYPAVTEKAALLTAFWDSLGEPIR